MIAGVVRVAGAAFLALVPLGGRVAGDEIDRERLRYEYRELALPFSMDHAQGGQERLLRKRRGSKIAARIRDLDLRIDPMQRAARSAADICDAYQVRWDSLEGNYHHAIEVMETTYGFGRAATGWLQGDGHGADQNFYNATATLESVMDRYAEAEYLFGKIKADHSALWEQLSAVADHLAGPEVEGMAIEPGVVYVNESWGEKKRKRFIELRLTNKMRVPLTGVTLCFDCDQNCLPEAAEPHWIFVEEWGPEESIVLPPVLVEELRRVDGTPQPIKQRVAYLEAWCDQFHQPKQDLQMFIDPPRMIRRKQGLQLYAFTPTDGLLQAPPLPRVQASRVADASRRPAADDPAGRAPLPATPEVPEGIREAVGRVVEATSKGKVYEGTITKSNGDRRLMTIRFLSFNDLEDRRAARIELRRREKTPPQIFTVDGRISGLRVDGGTEVDAVLLRESAPRRPREYQLVFEEDGTVSGFGPREALIELAPAEEAPPADS